MKSPSNRPTFPSHALTVGSTALLRWTGPRGAIQGIANDCYRAGQGTFALIELLSRNGALLLVGGGSRHIFTTQSVEIAGEVFGRGFGSNKRSIQPALSDGPGNSSGCLGFEFQVREECNCARLLLVVHIACGGSWVFH